jgi:Rrf2 family protein
LAGVILSEHSTPEYLTGQLQMGHNDRKRLQALRTARRAFDDNHDFNYRLLMQLSMRTDYALRALFTLVEHYGGQPIPIIELARRNDIPKRFLEHIMLDLKERGWVDSVAGKRGGYRLSKSPERITMGEVVRHFDGYLAPLACVSVSDYKRCSQEPVCRFRRVMLQSRNMVAQLMDNATLAEVMKGKPVSDAEVAAIQGIHGEGI